MTNSKPTKFFIKGGITLAVIMLLSARLFVVFQELAKTISKNHAPVQDFFTPNAIAIRSAAQTVTINQLIPAFDSLWETNVGTVTPSLSTLAPAQKYYRKIIEYYPYIPEAYVVLGFCESYEGKEEEAIKAFQKSLELNPYFFFSHYNLGVLYARKGDFNKAAISFQKSLSLPAELTLRIILTSKIYQQILTGKTNTPPQLLTESIQKAYSESLLGLQLSQRALTHDDERPQIKDHFVLRLKIF